MWARVVECMLGIWLWMSPFIFRHDPADAAIWINDLATGTILVVISLLSFWRPLKQAHWALLVVGAWLVAFGRLAESPPLAAGYQNHILLGLTVMMMAVIPSEASQPPDSWRLDDP